MSIVLFILYLLALVLVFYILSKVCTQYFVESLELLARRLKLSQNIAGATLMAFSGSAPEFLIVIITLLHPGNHANFGAGSIIGSAIFNILVVVGVSAIIYTTVLSWKPIVRDIIFYIVAIVSLFLIFQDGQVHWFEALAFIVLYLLYLFTLYAWQQVESQQVGDPRSDEFADAVEAKTKKRYGHKNIFWRALSLIDRLLDKLFKNLDLEPQHYLRVFVSSLLLIGLLSFTLVEIVIRLSGLLHVPETFIALTVVAWGTSIPDLMGATYMARRGRGGMAIADALGSNIFDIFIGFGLPWLIYTAVTQKAVIVSIENLRGSIILLSATVVLTFILLLLRHFKVNRSAGVLLLLCYGVYLLFTVLEIFHLV